MKMTESGQLVVKETDVIQALYQEKTVNNLVVEDTGWIEKYNKLADLFDFPESKINFQVASQLSSSEFVEQCVSEQGWPMPQEYRDLDIQEYLFDKLPGKDKITTEYKRMMMATITKTWKKQHLLVNSEGYLREREFHHNP